MKIRIIIKRIIVYILCLLLSFMFETCIFPLFSSVSAHPNLLLFFVFSYGLMYGTKIGMLSGIVAGILLDLFYSGPFGFFILVFTYIGYFSGRISSHFHDDSISLPLFICFLSEIIYSFSMLAYKYFTTGRIDMKFSLRYIILPEICITLLFTLIFYRIFLSFSKKMDSSDNLRGKNLA